MWSALFGAVLGEYRGEGSWATDQLQDVILTLWPVRSFVSRHRLEDLLQVLSGSDLGDRPPQSGLCD